MRPQVVGACIAGLLAVAGVARAQGTIDGIMQLASADARPMFYTILRPGAAPVDAHEAAAFTRRVTLDLTDAPLGDALAEISKQTGVRFGFGAGVAATLVHATIHAQRITVAGALTDILLGSGLDVLLARDGRSAELVRRPGAPPGERNSAAARPVQGTGDHHRPRDRRRAQDAAVRGLGPGGRHDAAARRRARTGSTALRVWRPGPIT